MKPPLMKFWPVNLVMKDVKNVLLVMIIPLVLNVTLDLCSRILLV